MLIVFLCLFSYLLGSIPFGLIISYLVKGIDIRKFGSGNIGATNVTRVVGKKWGVLVFVLDFLKAAIPIIILKFFGNFLNYVFIFVATSAVIGHNWPIFLKFKGGKGVATSLGAMVGLSFVFKNLWIVILLSLVIWMIIFFTFRYVSLASLLASFVFFVSSFFLIKELEFKIFSLVLFMFIVLRHKQNIMNLLKKKELRF